MATAAGEKARSGALCALLAALFLLPPAASCGLLPDNAFTDDARGLVAAQFLKAPVSARYAALGGAGLALGGPDALFLNPAGARSAGGASASASYAALLEGASRASLAFSRASGAGTFTAGAIYNTYGAGDRLDASGAGVGQGLASYDSAFAAGWAGRSGRFDLGLGLKYVRTSLAGEAGSSAALDAGLVYREPYPSRTELALAVRNFGPPLKLGSSAAPLPFEAGAGLKWLYTPDFAFLLEGRLPSDHSPYLAFAGEWYLPFDRASGLALRSGLNFRNYDDHGFMGAFTAGFGLKFSGVALDYAFVPYGDLGATHRMTAGWAWGASPAASPAPARRRAAPLLAVAPFEPGPGVTATEAEVVRGLAEGELARTGAFRASDRTRLDMILAEKKLEYAGLSWAGAAAALARSAGADFGVTGGVRRDGEGYIVTLELVDPAGGQVIASEAARAGGDYLLRDASRRAAAALAAR